ncbi:hypothetical protein ACET3Z_023580 [Daucus carota]
MELVSKGKSALNPNASLFIPAALRQVEDFSPEWWQLVTTSTWFHTYWLSQQGENDDFHGCDEDDSEDIVNLLPDTIDLGTVEEFLDMETQFEQFLQSSEAEAEKKSSLSASKETPGSGQEVDPVELMKSLGLSNSFKEKSPRSTLQSAKYWEKPAKSASPKSCNRRIQQPR